MELVKEWYGRRMRDWEHELAFRSTDRVVRPFDWGVEFARGWPFESYRIRSREEVHRVESHGYRAQRRVFRIPATARLSYSRLFG